MDRGERPSDKGRYHWGQVRWTCPHLPATVSSWARFIGTVGYGRPKKSKDETLGIVPCKLNPLVELPLTGHLEAVRQYLCPPVAQGVQGTTARPCRSTAAFW